MTEYKFDGEDYELVDYDKDKKTTQIYSQGTINEIKQVTELSESIKELNSDVVEDDTKMSSIDVKSRLSLAESGPILAYDTLVALDFLPQEALFLTRQRKRLSVSEEGLGRRETIEMAGAQRGHKEAKGFLGKLGNMFNHGDKNQ